MRVVNNNLSTCSTPSSKQQPSSTGAVPRGLRNLPPAPAVSPATELQRLRADAAALEAWWKDPRWYQTKRVYSGTYVSNDRGGEGHSVGVDVLHFLTCVNFVPILLQPWTWCPCGRLIRLGPADSASLLACPFRRNNPTSSGRCSPNSKRWADIRTPLGPWIRSRSSKWHRVCRPFTCRGGSRPVRPVRPTNRVPTLPIIRPKRCPTRYVALL